MSKIKGATEVEADPGQGGDWKGSSSSRRLACSFPLTTGFLMELYS